MYKMPMTKYVNHSGLEQMSKKYYRDAGTDLRVDLHKKIELYTKEGHVLIDDSTLDSIELPAFSRAVFITSLKVAISMGYMGQICDKSGLASKYGLTILGGICDSGFTGYVKVTIFNSSFEPYTFYHGDKIGQLVKVPIDLDGYQEVDELEDTDRGDNGHGSTGR